MGLSNSTVNKDVNDENFIIQNKTSNSLDPPLLSISDGLTKLIALASSSLSNIENSTISDVMANNSNDFRTKRIMERNNGVNTYTTTLKDGRKVKNVVQFPRAKQKTHEDARAVNLFSFDLESSKKELKFFRFHDQIAIDEMNDEMPCSNQDSQKTNTDNKKFNTRRFHRKPSHPEVNDDKYLSSPFLRKKKFQKGNNILHDTDIKKLSRSSLDKQTPPKIIEGAVERKCEKKKGYVSEMPSKTKHKKKAKQNNPPKEPPKHTIATENSYSDYFEHEPDSDLIDIEKLKRQFDLKPTTFKHKPTTEPFLPIDIARPKTPELAYMTAYLDGPNLRRDSEIPFELRKIEIPKTPPLMRKPVLSEIHKPNRPPTPQNTKNNLHQTGIIDKIPDYQELSHVNAITITDDLEQSDMGDKPSNPVKAPYANSNTPKWNLEMGDKPSNLFELPFMNTNVQRPRTANYNLDPSKRVDRPLSATEQTYVNTQLANTRLDEPQTTPKPLHPLEKRFKNTKMEKPKTPNQKRTDKPNETEQACNNDKTHLGGTPSEEIFKLNKAGTGRPYVNAKTFKTHVVAAQIQRTGSQNSKLDHSTHTDRPLNLTDYMTTKISAKCLVHSDKNSNRSETPTRSAKLERLKAQNMKSHLDQLDQTSLKPKEPTCAEIDRYKKQKRTLDCQEMPDKLSEIPFTPTKVARTRTPLGKRNLEKSEINAMEKAFELYYTTPNVARPGTPFFYTEVEKSHVTSTVNSVRSHRSNDLVHIGGRQKMSTAENPVNPFELFPYKPDLKTLRTPLAKDQTDIMCNTKNPSNSLPERQNVATRTFVTEKPSRLLQYISSMRPIEIPKIPPGRNPIGGSKFWNDYLGMDKPSNVIENTERPNTAKSQNKVDKKEKMNKRSPIVGTKDKVANQEETKPNLAMKNPEHPLNTNQVSTKSIAENSILVKDEFDQGNGKLIETNSVGTNINALAKTAMASNPMAETTSLYHQQPEQTNDNVDGKVKIDQNSVCVCTTIEQDTKARLNAKTRIAAKSKIPLGQRPKIHRNHEPSSPINLPAAEEIPAAAPSPQDPHPNETNEGVTTSMALVCQTSDSTKAFIKYSHTAETALSMLNDTVSSVLRENFCNIDDICSNVRQTMEKINEGDKLYEKLKFKQKPKSQSTPHLLEPDVTESQNSNLSHALSIGLVQTQSENQLRLAVLPAIDEATTENLSRDELPLEIPPLDMAAILDNPTPILPKLIPVEEPIGFPCETLKQQKKDMFNIPPRIPIQETPSWEMREKCYQDALKMPSTPFSKIHSKKFLNKDFPPEIKQRLKDIAARLGLDDLPRSKGLPDLHHKLIKEFEVTDSLVEFQRQMKHAKETEAQLPESTITNQPFQIIAEELFVPERKINKIAATNLNAVSKNKPPYKLGPKTCQFLYREKKKKRDLGIGNKINDDVDSKYSLLKDFGDGQGKYADSLWFCARGGKKPKSFDIKPNTPVAATKSSTVVVCGSNDNLDLDTDTQIKEPIQDKNDDDYKDKCNRLIWPRINIQSLVTYKTGLDCFDILDEISLRDLKPLESEYPRRDHLGLEPYVMNVENMFLYKLVYGSARDQFLHLLKMEEPSVLCKTPGCHACAAKTKAHYCGPDPDRRDDDTSISDIEHTNYTGESTQKRSSSADKAKLTIASDTKNVAKLKQRVRQRPKTPKKPVTDEDVANKLRPYIFDPRMRYPTTITVMPVSVTYENPNFNKPLSINNMDNDKPVKLKKPKAPLPDKKLWGNKHSKTPSYNLMSYLEKQNVEKPQPVDEYWGDLCQNNPNTVNSPVVKQRTPRRSIYSVTEPSPTCPTLPTSPQRSKPATPVSTVSKNLPKQKKQPSRNMFPKKDLETNIQTVIDTIEGKIVDIISCPDKSHSETFNNVEQQIMQILQTIRVDPTLDAIVEDSDVKEEPKKPKKKNKFYSKTSSDLIKTSELRSRTDTQLAPKVVVQSPMFAMPPLAGKPHDEAASSNTSGTTSYECFEVTSACAPQRKLTTPPNEKKEAVTVKSEEFLTPFMQALKQFRQVDHGGSSNILEFLDTLSSISTDAPLPAGKDIRRRSVVNYRRSQQLANVLQEAQIFYPIGMYQPVVFTTTSRHGLLDMGVRKNVAKEFDNARKLFSALNLSSFFRFGSLIKDPNPMQPRSILCCCAETPPQRVVILKPTAFDQTVVTDAQIISTGFTNNTADKRNREVLIYSDEHAQFLNSVYGVLFTAIFLGLTFNYSCQ